SRARRPVIYAGDGVAFSGAQAELTRVAELLGAEVWEADAGEVNMASDHPLYRGMTGHMFGEHSLPITRSGDANLVVGTYMLPEVFPVLGDIYAPGATVIHIDLDLDAMARNHRVDLGLLGDPKTTLAKLAQALEAALSDAQREAAGERATALGRAKAEQLAAERERDAALQGQMPLHMPEFAQALAAQ